MAFKAPGPFNFKEKQSWPEWRERWRRFYNLTDLSKKPKETQVDALIYTMGKEAESQFVRFQFSNEQKKDYEHVLNTFDNYFTPDRNVIHERAVFGKRNQKDSESIHDYVQDLYELSTYCDFGNKEEAIRDRLILGLKDTDLSEKLQLESGLTLDRAVKMAKQKELVQHQIQQQRASGDVSVDYATRGGSHRRPPRKNKFQHHNRQQHPQPTTCTRCGGQHGDKTVCPAKGKRCRKCNKMSHFAKFCRSKSVSEVQRPEALTGSCASSNTGRDSESEPDTFLLLGIEACEGEDEPPWKENIQIRDRKVCFKLDCGADVTVINKRTWVSLGKPKLQQTRYKLKGASHPLKVLGFIKETLNNTLVTTVYVVDEKVENLLSRAASKSLNFINRVPNDVGELHSIEYGEVQCPPVKIKLREGAVPHAVHTARRVPIPLIKKVEEELARMREGGIIEAISEPTEWIHPMVPVVKPNGKIRVCVDLKKLNQAVQRERYMIPTIDDVVHQVASSTVFSKLDAASGFFQLRLDPSSAKLTTFITPFGRFFFTHVPMGLSSAPEIFQRIMTDILKGIPGVIVYFDDILLHSKTTKEHEGLTKRVKAKLSEVGLKLNEDKCEYGKQEIKFLGHLISKDGVRPDSEKIAAITKMNEPTDPHELRRFLGLVNFLGKYVPHLSSTMRPMTELLEKDRAWCWGPSQANAFVRVKEALTTAPTLAYFDAAKPTTVSADASAYGIGAVLLQDHGDLKKPVAYCSRTLTKSEKHYAQIEKECLASVWACERFERYLVGLEEFTIETDHKPLVPLINSKHLSETPIRCQRMLIRLMRFSGMACYTPGKFMHVADALSRAPLKINSEVNSDVEVHVESVKATWPIGDCRLEDIRRRTMEDVSVKTALEYTVYGWPEYKENVMLAAREYYDVRNELSVVDGLLVRGDRIVIPFAMRNEVLERIHDGHLGINKCRERANSGVWWPSMSKHITDRVAKCQFCMEKQSSQKSEPLMISSLPQRPFEKVGIDICEYRKQHFIVQVDYYSRYIDIAKLPSLSATSVIGKVKGFFAHHGIPNTVISDNGPQFSSREFVSFARNWGFTHITSSPHYAQSNGGAERAVKTAKEILRQDDVFLALLTYRSTPIHQLGASPAELAMGRKIRSTLPQLPSVLIPKAVDAKQLRKRDATFKQQQASNFDRHKGVQRLPDLRPGDPVLVKLDGEKGWRSPAEVVEKCAPRSYVVDTPGGQVRRNRRHLKLRPDAVEDHQQQSDLQPTAAESPLQHHLSPSLQPRQMQPSEKSPSLSSDITDNSKSSVSSGETTSATPVGFTRSGRAVIKPARFQ